MSDLTLSAVTRTLAGATAAFAAHQRTEPGSPECGAVIQPAWGIADPSATAALLASLGMLRIAQDAGCTAVVADGDQRAALAAEALLRAQHPSGRIDLRVANYDSAPDTAFTMQWLAPVVELLRERGIGGAWDAIRGQIETYLERGAHGLLQGGFHTPNHRWVMCGALAEAGRLFPGIPLQATLDAYLAEGYDIDADGFYTERSAGVYDAVCNLSLLLIAARTGDRAALDAVRANLETNWRLFHSDGTVDTALSLRQDRGTRSAPATLAAPYLMLGMQEGIPRFVETARWLWAMSGAWERAHPAPQGVADLRGREANWMTAARWLALAILRHGEPEPCDPAPIGPCRHRFAGARLWRVREDAWSASVYGSGTRLLSMCHGGAELASVKISQTYFGEGRFAPTVMEGAGDGVRLQYCGSSRPHRPGYDHPLGRRVEPERWVDEWLQRDWRPIPPCAGEVTVEPEAGGLRLRYRTTDGLPEVPAQIALDFAPGGIWDTGDTRLEPQPGQVVFLKRGAGTMWFGPHGIEIGPGAHAHCMAEMHDTEPAPGMVRVLLTFLTPVDAAVTLRAARLRP